MGGEDGIPVVAMLGRVFLFFIYLYSYLFTLNIVFKFHPYEGHTLSTVVFPVRVMANLGIKDLISESPIFVLFYYLHLQLFICLVTNAAGSLNPNIPVGTSKYKNLSIFF